MQSQDQAIWWDTLNKMQKLLRKAVHTCFLNGQVDHDAMHNYFMSGMQNLRINWLIEYLIK